MKMDPYFKFKRTEMDAAESPIQRRGINKFDGIIVMIITAAIALAILGQLGPSAVAPGITSSQDTANITGYSTWSTQAQQSYKSTGGNMALVWFIIPFILLLALLKYVG